MDLVGSSLLLAVDSAFAAGALRMRFRSDQMKWQLPVAFAVCDGLSSLLGSVARIVPFASLGSGRAIILGAYAAAAGLLLISWKSERQQENAWLRFGIALLAIPILLGADNFFAHQASPGKIAPGMFGAMAGASFGMSLLGLTVADMVRSRANRPAWAIPISMALLLLAFVTA
jgi:hypothetical protein